MSDIPDIDFQSMETDVDEFGLIASAVTDDNELGVETRYARLTYARTTETFAEFHGDHEDCYVAIRVPLSVLENMVKKHTETGGATSRMK